jgi:hypothetical protein
MVPIYLNGRNEDYSFQSFHENMIKICNEHINDGRALAFAFILYDFTNESLVKALQNKVNWKALHELSGKYLTVFSIHTKGRQRVRANNPASDNRFTQYMTTISSYESPKESENLLLKKYFKSDVKFPAILFFQVDKLKVIDSVIFELEAQGEDNIYYEMKNYIIAAVKALQNIPEGSNEDNLDIFRELKGNVNQVQAKKNYKKVGKKVMQIGEILALISSLIKG